MWPSSPHVQLRAGVQLLWQSDATAPETGDRAQLRGTVTVEAASAEEADCQSSRSFAHELALMPAASSLVSPDLLPVWGPDPELLGWRVTPPSNRGRGLGCCKSSSFCIWHTLKLRNSTKGKTTWHKDFFLHHLPAKRKWAPFSFSNFQTHFPLHSYMCPF